MMTKTIHICETYEIIGYLLGTDKDKQGHPAFKDAKGPVFRAMHLETGDSHDLEESKLCEDFKKSCLASESR